MDVPLIVKTAAVIAINGFRLKTNLFGTDDALKKFFDRFEKDAILSKSLGPTIRSVRPIVASYVVNYRSWGTSRNQTPAAYINPHLFVQLVFHAMNPGDGYVELSAKPPYCLGAYMTIAVDDGEDFDDDHYKALVLQMLTDTVSGGSVLTWFVATPLSAKSIDDAADAFIAAVNTMTAHCNVVVDSVTLGRVLNTLATGTKAFYNAIPTAAIQRDPQ